MRVLFDQGTPAPLRRVLSHHTVATAFERGWATLRNGDLLSAAERDGFDVLVTTDSNLRYQQNLSTRRIAVVVLTTTSWPRIQGATALVVAAVDQAADVHYAEVVIP
jgi:predicted nuclease of predicted toxin-antitoxin system